MISFSKVLRVCGDVAESLPDHVFIGGVAVYLHAINEQRGKTFAEASHDADFMLSLADFAILRDDYEVTMNRRLEKHQIIVDGVELDVYIEHQNNLAVPYDAVFAHADMYGPLRVACLEHLLILKLRAFESRKRSAKGDKDARDVIVLGLLMGRKPNTSILKPYFDDEQKQTVDDVKKSGVFMDMTVGNAHEAKKLRKAFDAFVANLPR